MDHDQSLFIEFSNSFQQNMF